MIRSWTCGQLLLLVLGLALTVPATTEARWNGIDRQENRILFSGMPPGAEHVSHRHVRHEDLNGRRELYEAHWKAAGRRLPLLRIRLHLWTPEHASRTAGHKSLEENIQTHPLFRGRAFAALEAGTAKSVLGDNEYLVFKAGKDRCGTWRIYLYRNAGAVADGRGDTMVTGLSCPVTGDVDATIIVSMLSRVGIRGIATPGTDPAAASSGRTRNEDLFEVVRTGNMKRLRRIAVRGLDPDTTISFNHPLYARGRTLHAPMIVAASLYGHTEMAVFLLDHGAGTHLAAASAICAAVARNHPDIVRVLLEADPALANYERCGRNRTQPPLAVAKRLHRWPIVELLRNAGAR